MTDINHISNAPRSFLNLGSQIHACHCNNLCTSSTATNCKMIYIHLQQTTETTHHAVSPPITLLTTLSNFVNLTNKPQYPIFTQKLSISSTHTNTTLKNPLSYTYKPAKCYSLLHTYNMFQLHYASLWLRGFSPRTRSDKVSHLGWPHRLSAFNTQMSKCILTISYLIIVFDKWLAVIETLVKHLSCCHSNLQQYKQGYALYKKLSS